MKMPQIYDAIILGAGASGLFCAAEAISRGKKVAVLEHNDRPLRKIAVSGGGKCNFTNLAADWKHYLSDNPKFTVSALSRFPPQQLLDLVAGNNIRIYQKTPGRYFCTDGAQKFMQMLLAQISETAIFYNTVFKEISRQQNLFHILTSRGEFTAQSLVIATGGASYPNLGATSDGLMLAKQFGHKIIPARPALVPFNLTPQQMEPLRNLQGISLPAAVSINNQTFTDDLLFTHFGLSGPAILQASLYWVKNQTLTINLLPQTNLFNFLKNNQNGTKCNISTILKKLFPERVVSWLLNGEDFRLAEAGNKKIQALADRINRWQVVPSSTAGYRLAEVMAGGVDTTEISSSTMESKIVSGLYFCGEVLDITGQLGGYNIQWAYSSGTAAGKNL